MPLLALGINHNTAPVQVRERVAFAPESMAAALVEARSVVGCGEMAILSTCNRSEIYADSDSIDAVLGWLSRHHKIPEQELRACCYAHMGADSVRHMMTVACGLDSLVLGEPQILGQMKSAYTVAREAGTVGSILHSAFQQVFSVAKRVRTETAIGENPVSVAYAAVSLASRIFSDLHDQTALLIGAGETVELVARHLVEQGVKRIYVANRTLRRAEELAESFGAEAILLADIPEHLAEADIVISSTASQLPILGKGAVESALRTRKHRPMFMVDIAVPRDIEAEVAELDDVYLYTVDDLRSVIDEGMRSREEAAEKARGLIVEATDDFMREFRALDGVDTIRSFREMAAKTRDDEMARALTQLQSGGEPEKVLQALARSLTNKLIHAPTVSIKQASADGDLERIQLLRELLGLVPDGKQ
ncbi:glutamyl-tRNA reductase [Biformimicrobium ophioploci]|uniref:Glutamyl-tRNA reductase n=1 Tax=Biformimicrobium ophioploci TaxID=3036711 RepID=A0ABQ6LWS4_9GAMM|nr:glutamyl-tRNA reductase [Microbulbifer sp. NKW57]GMG86552.1 glutamyl-tRNA reductase [Microbulbifer sp. NKW57]